MFDVWRVGDKLELRSRKKDSDGNPAQKLPYSEERLEVDLNRAEGGRKAAKTAREHKTIIPKSALDDMPALKSVFGANVGSDYSNTFDGVLIGNSSVWNEGKDIVTGYDETIVDGYRDALGLSDDVEVNVDDVIEQAQQEVELYRDRGGVEQQLAQDLEIRIKEELKEGEMSNEEIERLASIATEEELQRETEATEAEIGLLETETLENEKPVVQEPAPKKPKQAPEKPTAPNVPPKPPKPPEDTSVESEDMGKSLSPDVQKNLDESRGVRKESFIKRHKAKFVQIKNDFTRHFPDISPKKYPNISNTMRVAESAREGAVAKTQNRLSEILGGMTEPEYRNFSMQLILPDMLADIKKFDIQLEDGEKFNFGYESVEQIQEDLDHFKKTAPKKVKDALKQREDTLNALRQEMVDLKILPKEVLNQPYFHRQVLEHMEMKGLPTGSTAKGLRLGPKSWAKKRVGSVKDFNTDYIEAEYEVLAQGYESVAVKKALDSIGKEANIAPELRKKAKEQDVPLDEVIPEGYVGWSPQIGTRWFQAATVDQKVMQQIQVDGEALVGKADFNKIFAATSKDLWVIPEDLANALNNFKKYETKNVYTGFSLAVRNKWKQWTLLNPKSAVKYNINNLSGDADIVIAYDYKIITKYSRQAAKDLWAYFYNRKKLSKAKLAEIEKAMDESVLNSGITMQEIPDLADNQSLDNFMRKLVPGGDKGSKVGKLPLKYWQGVKDITNFRENVLRLAALRSFQDKIAKGLQVYGASNRTEVDGIKDDYTRAAKLSRELVGDYGNLTAAGEMIRQHMIYFYSWMEINAPRYVRLMKNAPYEQVGMKRDKDGTWVPKGRSRASTVGRVAGIAAKKTAGGAAKTAVKATAAYAGLTASSFAMYTLISLWNETMFPEEAEELSRQDASKFGIILGRYHDGSIRTLKFQGALSDALGWFALDDPKSTLEALRDDEMTATELLKKMVTAGPERLFNASIPFMKMGAELVTGKKLFPNPLKPSPIMDKAEHLARLFALDGVYRDVAGKPSPDKGALEHIVNTIQGLAFYSTDPGEVAYWSAVSDMHKFQESLGIEKARVNPTKKSKALYYYKQSMKYGDLKAGLKYYRKYKELGGTEESMEASVKLLAPEMALREELRDSYINTLSKKQAKTLVAAQQWYEETYK
ncbi:MAG: hypothetical protein ISR74_06780 [Candidatus Thioglobus sp.]|nr:hypothetical protein [Candidatus Thioglobus sp.]